MKYLLDRQHESVCVLMESSLVVSSYFSGHCPFTLDQIKDSGSSIVNYCFQGPLYLNKGVWADTLWKSLCLCDPGRSPVKVIVQSLGLLL